MFHNHYSSPPGFDFDLRFRNRPLITNKKSEYYNGHEQAGAFIRYLNTIQPYYKSTQNLLVLMGEDFEYENALYNYYSIDNLIEAVNEYD